MNRVFIHDLIRSPRDLIVLSGGPGAECGDDAGVALGRWRDAVADWCQGLVGADAGDDVFASVNAVAGHAGSASDAADGDVGALRRKALKALSMRVSTEPLRFRVWAFRASTDAWVALTGFVGGRLCAGRSRGRRGWR
jgi:hypothetical protein